MGSVRYGLARSGILVRKYDSCRPTEAHLLTDHQTEERK
jgi:hypothetical protein